MLFFPAQLYPPTWPDFPPKILIVYFLRLKVCFPHIDAVILT